MCIKLKNPKMKQSEIAKQLGYSSSTIQRYGNDINMLIPYRIQPNDTNKRVEKKQILFLKTIHIPNMTPKDLK